MVEADIGDDRDIRIDRVHRVEATAEAHFQYRVIALRRLDDVQRRQHRVLEIRQVDAAAPRFHGLEGGDDGGVAGVFAVDADAFVENVQMRRRGGARRVAAGKHQPLDKANRGTLAIGAGDNDVGWRRRIERQPAHHIAHAVEAAQDATRMFDADAFQPSG